MRKFARPVFITILAAAIVLGVAMFASSRVSRGGIETYQAPVFVHVRNNVPEANDALRVASANQGVPKTALLAPMPPPHSARQNMPATQIARTMARKDVSPKGVGSGIRMIQYFINRAGKGLSPSRRRELERAKRILQRRAAARRKRQLR